MALPHLLWEAKTVVARYPSVALPMARIRRRGVPVARSTQVVIEGFPRTASSFAVAMFQMAQPDPVRLAHHVHAPAQLIQAVRWDIPAMALIREPEETVLSFVIRNPGMTLEEGLRSYVRFYAPLLAYASSLVLAPFETVTSDFGSIIRGLNRRYGTSFGEIEHVEEHARACLQEIEWDYRARIPGERLEMVIPRPSMVRARMKDELRGGYRSPELDRLGASAREVYARFMEGSCRAETSP